jgi:uncharacterized Zn-binding protein involved in type VI secretion
MPGVARITADSAGGTLIGVLAPSVYINGNNIAVLNCAVQGHGTGAHAAPIMTTASPNVYANGIKVCRQGDSTSCSHTATGSGNVFANDHQ